MTVDPDPGKNRSGNDSGHIPHLLEKRGEKIGFLSFSFSSTRKGVK
jgi:hypothetical protein